MKFLIRENFFKSVPKEKLEIVMGNLKYFYKEIEKNSKNIKNIPSGFWIKKLAGVENRFEFRVNNGDRIFFSLAKRDAEEERITFLLYSSHDHGVKKSKRAEIQNVKDFEISKENFESTNVQELDKSIFLNYNNVITYEIKNDNYFIANKDNKYFYYYLNDEQYETIISPSPLFVIGSAGSGKSTITLRKILNIEEHNNIYNFEKIGYFTGNSYLKDSIEEQYKFFRDKSKKEVTHFYTLKEYYKKELNIDTRKIINFKKFMEFLSFSYPNRKKFKIEDSNIYFEIVGIIKGLMIKSGADNWEKDLNISLISLDEYKKLSKKYSVLSDDLKEEIYKIALKYEDWKKENSLYDVNDLAVLGIEKKNDFDFILVDEVQDLTETEIYFLTKIVKYPENIIFAGDIHQMVNFNSFSFDRLKNLYYKNNMRYSLSTLIKNYRSSKEIVKLANYLTDLRKKYIGNLGMDDYKEGAILDEGNIIFSNTDFNFAEKFQKDVNSAIIVSDDEERRKFSEISGIKHRIFTVEEIKGLEYRDIICYNLISKNLWAWKKILSGNVKQDQRYRKYFNLFYVGITRARKNLIIMEDSLENNELLQNIKSFVDIKGIDERDGKKEEIIKNSSFSSKEEWLQEGIKLYKLEKFDEAQYAFEQGDYPTWIAEKETEIDIENGDYKIALEKIEKGNFKKNRIYFEKLIIDNIMEGENYIKALKYIETFNTSYKYFEIKKKISEGLSKKSYTTKDINKIIPIFLNRKEFSVVGDLYFYIEKYDLSLNFYKKASNVDGIIKSRREILKEKFKDISERDSKIKEVEELIGKKDVNTVDRLGKTPLMKVMTHKNSEDMAEMLITLGLNLNEKIKIGNVTGNYVHFTQFLLEDKTKWLKFLSKHGANLNAETNRKETPIFYAGGFENKDSIDFLIKNGCDINHRDANGETVDFIKLRERRVKYFKFFVEKMDEIDKKNKYGETILDIIVKMKEEFSSNDRELRKINIMEKIYKRNIKMKK
ncbi:UvrD-helicase domain-containing protein [Fusobacterium sp.]|uniref:UvrD-helicase domain-containing protein n=1 Tax=Fusobacterium sp. TaxID=68766 RepID=UPI00260648FD|nr:UvrD-helicase domain-containing protein [Fusobacterium sp.]